MQNFDYLKDIPELSELYALCSTAEARQYIEPDISAISCRRALEWLVKAIYAMKGEDIPERANLFELTSSETYAGLIADERLMAATHWIRKVGNIAAHEGNVTRRDAFFSVLNLYNLVGGILLKLHVLANLAPFDKNLLPTNPAQAEAPAVVQHQPTAEEFAATVTPMTIAKASTVVPAVSWTGISEAETRRRFIDLMLREAGWEILDTEGDIQPSKACIEIEVHGMPNPSKVGYADYVLFGADGNPLALIEAKRTSIEPEQGRHQAELYAECLEKEYGVRPIIYYTNGFTVNIIDGLGYPPRPLLGFHTEKDLQRLHYQRTHRRPISDFSVKGYITDRYYQKRAVKVVCEHLNTMHRRGLIVMATGTGKTRTAISLVDVLSRAEWVKDILFLADRTTLVRQAARNFGKLLPGHTLTVLSDKTNNDRDFNARMIFSTYQTMINYVEDESKNFSLGRFDLIIIDEAHRSVFGKYGSIFKYFDSFLIGLTATPREEVARSTYDLLGLEGGEPNYAYELYEAVKDGYLVPYAVYQRGSAIVNSGIKYSDLGEDEKRQIEEITEYEGQLDPDGKPVGRDIAGSEIFKYIFNADTIDKVLQDLMDNGLKIDNGEKIGKTIIFAFNHKHAEMIVRRFNVLYPEYGPDFCRLIDNYEKYAEDLVDRFCMRDKLPQIAVSVDMLDTGVDAPDVLNLVFFKRVRSHIKFMQMIGRGTRLCPDIFGAGKDKTQFYIFDWCGNFAFFGMNPKGAAEQPSSTSPTEQIFGYRAEIAQHLQDAKYQAPESWTLQWHDELKKMLLEQVSTLNDSHPKVRDKWEQVSRFRNPNTWKYISVVDVQTLKNDIAPLLPKSIVDIQALEMDILVLRIQLSLLDKTADSKGAPDKIISVAAKLQKRASIPQVAAKMATINEVLSNMFWENVSVQSIERVRRELRDLLKFLQSNGSRTFEVDIEDTITVEEAPMPYGLPHMSYKQKVIDFLTENRNLPVLHKIQNIEQLTHTDIDELERILWTELGTKEDYDKCLQREQLQCGNSVGAFIRTLIAVDLAKALKMFSEFISQNSLNSEQEEFLKSILDYVCLNGDMPIETLITAEPFKDIELAQLFPGKAPKVAEFVRHLHESINAA